MKIKIEREGVNNATLFVEFIQQNHQKLGTKRPVIFILPGGPGADHTIYEKYRCLEDVADLVFHDPRGCGQSSRDNVSSYNMKNYIDDVESIRTALKLDEVIILGKSYGAMCAVGYALKYPKALQKLILSAGAPSFRFLEEAKQIMKRIGTPEQIAIAEKLWAGKLKNSDEVALYFQLTNSLYSVKAKKEKADTVFTQKSQHIAYQVLNEAFRRELWYFDYESDLQKITTPTLILAGREDWVTNAGLSEFMAARIPYSQLRVFDNASHSMELDVPKDYFQTIRDFVLSINSCKY